MASRWRVWQVSGITHEVPYMGGNLETRHSRHLGPLTWANTDADHRAPPNEGEHP